jgi:hypothetical protein
VSTVFLVSYIALWALVTVLSIGLFALYHHFGEMYLNSRDGRQNQGPETNRPLRLAQLMTISGNRIELPQAGSPCLVFFSDTACRLCENLVPDLTRLSRERTDLALTVICGGSEDNVREWARSIGGYVPVVADPVQVLTARYGVGMTPFAIAVDAKGLVKGKGLVNDGDGLSSLAAAATAGPKLVGSSRSNGGR